VRWPHPVLIFDEEEVGSELEPMAVVHPLRGLPFFGDEVLTLSHNAVRPPDEFQPLREEGQVIEGNSRTGAEPPLTSSSLGEDHEEKP
jgi:hypothetical protein